MNRLKELLSQVLTRVANYLLLLVTKLAPAPVEEHDIDEVDEVGNLFPHSFTTFKEGMASADYFTRHDAAAKLVGWYIHQQGTPYIEDLVRAAEILLEDTSATSREVSFLAGAWQDQASATNEKDREEAEERENQIYASVVIKTKN